jgi:Domain of Unknown Function (DUF1080)
MINRMRITVAFLIAVTVFAQAPAALTAPPPAVVTPKKTIILFNGLNLDGWYTWLQDNQYQDPKHVFTVQDGMLRISGEEWGGLTTQLAYRDYHLIAEWKWGGPNHGKREGHSRDSGILVHGVGDDGAHDGIWLQSIESQIIEGGTGDFIMVEGRERPTMTATVRQLGREFYWDETGKPQTLERGRFDWFGRDPNWKDQLGYRGPKDVEKPVGEWNRQEVIADGATLTNIVNGVVVNKGYHVYPTAGKIQIQSEGAEIYFRRIELMPLDRQQPIAH